MRGKVEIFAKKILCSARVGLFLVDANRCATAEGLPDYHAPADVRNFCTVRSLDAWDLSMLKVLNDDMRGVPCRTGRASNAARRARSAGRAEAQGEEERQARMKRDEARAQRPIFSDVAPRRSMASPVA